MEIDYFSRFTFDSVSHYQKFGNVEEKTCKWTLLGENTLMYETFAHTELNEEYRKLGFYCIPHKHIAFLHSLRFRKSFQIFCP